MPECEPKPGARGGASDGRPELWSAINTVEFSICLGKADFLIDIFNQCAQPNQWFSIKCFVCLSSLARTHRRTCACGPASPAGSRPSPSPAPTRSRCAAPSAAPSPPCWPSYSLKACPAENTSTPVTQFSISALAWTVNFTQLHSP